MKRLIVGCGYLGGRVAENWVRAGDDVFALTRSAKRAEMLAADGIQTLVGDVTDPSSMPDLPEVHTVLWAVGHDRQTAAPIEAVYVDGFAQLLARLHPNTQRVIYVSSTGVYGQQDGSWVDEHSECRPSRRGGKACLAAEEVLLGTKWSKCALILRLAGIYGRRRLPRLKQLLNRQSLTSDPEAVINLIHVDDAVATIVRAADLLLQLPRTYLVADGHPVVRRSFYEELAQRLNVPSPTFDSNASVSPDSRGSANHKRVTNARMLNELGVQLQFPTYREGLSAIAEGM